MLKTDNPNILKLIHIMGKQQLSMREMLERIGMKHRPTSIDNYLSPAVSEGYVSLLYPDSPRHPRQKYQLTVKGLALYNEIHN